MPKPSPRIALVSHSNLRWTGPLAGALARRGHRVRVLSFHPAPLAEGIDVVTIANDPSLPAWRYLVGARRLRRELQRFEPDVVLATYLSSNGACAALAGAHPLVVSLAGSDVLPDATAGLQRLPPFVQRAIVRFVARRAARLHSVSRPITETLVSYGVEANRIDTFPRGVRLEDFAPRASLSTAGPPGIICTRNQSAKYDNHVVVEALARLRAEGSAFCAELVGGGPLLEARRRQIGELGLGDVVRLRGALPHAEMAAALGAADVYVSAAPSDGTSSSLLEAMAVGLFPVVARIRANQDWVEHERSGLLFTPGDAGDLAAQLARALDDEDLRRSAQPVNRRRVEAEGDYDRNVDRLAAMLRAARAQ